MFKISIDASLEKDLEQLYSKVSNLSPLMRSIAGTMQSAVDQNFASGGRPKWLGVKRGGTPLNDTGVLKNSIQHSSDSKTALVGTNVEYAAIHQFGGKTRPHVIKPRFKKALAFNGMFAKSVNHPGSNIPARPFLQLTAQDENDIIQDVQDYFRTL